MVVRVVLVLLAAGAASSPEESNKHLYNVEDTNVAMLEEVDTAGLRPGNSSAPPAPESMNPEDANVIRGAIQKLLGGVDEVEYVAPTSPTRSPEPGAGGHAAAPSPGALAPEGPRDSPIQSYHKLLGQLVDYAQKMERTENPTRTQLARMPASDAVTPAGVSQTPTPLDQQLLLRQANRRTRATTTTTTPMPTKNPLCTHDFDKCKTMCFDEEKYRVTCTSSTTPATSPKVDVSKLMYMLEGLIKDYDTNLSDVFNKTLMEKGYDECRYTKPTTTTTGTTVEATPALYDYEASNKTGAVIAKCYVCGLTAPGIPEDAHCSDAFSGEFLPLTPVDASARGKLATFRKYCKYMDMLPWYVNGTDGRYMWGAWTGGCSVRWIDISGLYTQRSCRSRYHPATGSHFGSKRMAKLEKALMRVDNGCIASPMATLVPFSRGVSLYARFHACVCTGSFCNRSSRLHHHTVLVAQALVFFKLIG